MAQNNHFYKKLYNINTFMLRLLINIILIIIPFLVSSSCCFRKINNKDYLITHKSHVIKLPKDSDLSISNNKYYFPHIKKNKHTEKNIFPPRCF